MLKNYFRVAARALARRKLYAGINLVGMAIGLAAAILILLFVRFETSFDDFHESPERIFRVSMEERSPDGSSALQRALVSPAVGVSIQDRYPQIEAMARLTPVGPLLSRDDTHIAPENAFWADPSIFDVFTVDVLQGDPSSALQEPFTIALSENVASRLFGADNPIGELITVNDEDDFTVVAVFKELPLNSHIHFEVLGSIASLSRWFTARPLNEVWDSPNYLTYVKTAVDTDIPQLSSALSNHMATVSGVNVPKTSRIRFQNVRDIHLKSNVIVELEPQGSMDVVLLFTATAFFILLIAAINFTNLAVASSARRDREVGIRKASGAVRRQLILQFLGEAVVVTFFSMLLALAMVWAVLPTFNSFIGTPLSLADLGFWTLIGTMVTGCLFVGILAGSYPALYLSRLTPSQLFRGGRRNVKRGSGLRSTLIVVQFSIAVALTFATLVVFKQLSFVRTQNLGFRSENVVVLPPIREIATDFDAFREQLLMNPEILDVSQSNPSPMGGVIPPFDGTAYHDDHTVTATIYPVWIDHRYFHVFDIPMVAGRNFDPNRSNDESSGLILNEAAAIRFGWNDAQEAIGRDVYYGGLKRTVLGVVRDFHQENLHKAIVPMGFYQDARNFRAISVKYNTANFSNLVKFLASKWSAYHKNRPLDYEFLDERAATAYDSDQRLGSLTGAFASLGIFLSCLGLFGVAAVTVRQRRKEIGIRKTMGASEVRLVYTIASEFVHLSLIAIVFGGIVGYAAMNNWLNRFAYHSSIGFTPIILVALFTISATLFAVVFESISAAKTNPVVSLRHE